MEDDCLGSPVHAPLSLLQQLQQQQSQQQQQQQQQQSRLYAHHPRKKGAKHWNRTRPKKRRPSSINSKPTPYQKDPTDFVNAPPEYIAIPDEEGLKALRAEPLQQLLLLLQQQQQECTKDSPSLLRIPAPCNVRMPRSTAAAAAAVAAAIAAASPEEAAAATAAATASAAPALKDEAAAYAAALRSAAEAAANEGAAAVAAAFPDVAPGEGIATAAAAAIDTEAAQKLQQLSKQPQLHQLLQQLQQLAETNNDEPLKKIAAHLAAAVAPCKPPSPSQLILGPPYEDDQGGAAAAPATTASDTAGSGSSPGAAPSTAEVAEAAAKAAAADLAYGRTLLRRRRGLLPSFKALKLSPLNRFNPLLLLKTLDKQWQALQHRRYKGLFKRKLQQTLSLARRLQADGVSPRVLLEDGAFDRFGLLRDIPQTSFVECYLHRHSKPWKPPEAAAAAAAAAAVAAAKAAAPNDRQQHEEVLNAASAARAALLAAAMQRLQELGLITDDGKPNLMELRRMQAALQQQQQLPRVLSVAEQQELLKQQRLRPRSRFTRIVNRVTTHARAAAASLNFPVLGPKRNRKAAAAAATAAAAAVPSLEESEVFTYPSTVLLRGRPWSVSSEQQQHQQQQQQQLGGSQKEPLRGRALRVAQRMQKLRLKQQQMREQQQQDLQERRRLLQVAAEAGGVFDVLAAADYPNYKPLATAAELELFVEAEYRRHSLLKDLKNALKDALQSGPAAFDQPQPSGAGKFTAFIAEWMKLSKRRRRRLLLQELEAQQLLQQQLQRPQQGRRRTRRQQQEELLADPRLLLRQLRHKYDLGLLPLKPPAASGGNSCCRNFAAE
ncbi:hypothetical protein, conserved [Eimeria maxima]|uniref:Uncharacterized protein n=1 Tax=Eimeria maxima TaxID=5804 RepID=U6LYX2_EIMMA|nr:hypothetical protein, conserved [Eimeria maxima]CDJ57152.1 hypothetical protein, conserved [Eimeria maxima]